MITEGAKLEVRNVNKNDIACGRTKLCYPKLIKDLDDSIEYDQMTL